MGCFQFYRLGVVSGQYNTAGADNSIVAGGFSNLIGVVVPQPTNGASAFIGAGYNNEIAGKFSSIVGGQLNAVQADNSVVVGGVSIILTLQAVLLVAACKTILDSLRLLARTTTNLALSRADPITRLYRLRQTPHNFKQYNNTVNRKLFYDRWRLHEHCERRKRNSSRRLFESRRRQQAIRINSFAAGVGPPQINSLRVHRAASFCNRPQIIEPA